MNYFHNFGLIHIFHEFFVQIEKQNASFNDSFTNNSYSDFIWLPDKNHKDFDEFGDLPLSDSFEKEKI